MPFVCDFSTGLGGGGGAGRRLDTWTGAMGVCNFSACAYSSSSDDDGDEDRGVEMGDQKGLTFECKFNF